MTTRTLAYAFTPVLLTFAALQLNDPDPLEWAAIYTCAALVSLAYGARRSVHGPASGLALIAAVWALTLVPQARELADLTQRMDIMRPEVEVARELGGLAIVFAWMGALALLSLRAARARPSRSDHLARG